MKAKIYKPAKNVMQSGRGNLGCWLLEYELATKREPEALMGWTASGDTLNQVRLKFRSVDEARLYAEKHGMDYEILPPRRRKVRPRNYGDNFRYLSPDEHETA